MPIRHSYTGAFLLKVYTVRGSRQGHLRLGLFVAFVNELYLLCAGGPRCAAGTAADSES